jgi:transcriptional regulator with XRE-family HTH domain
MIPVGGVILATVPGPVTLATYLGRRLRLQRQLRRLSQEDVATLARRWGLAWTRSVVAAIEAGRRELSIEELILLPWIAAREGPERARRREATPVPFAELFPATLAPIQLTPRFVVTDSDLHLLLSGRSEECGFDPLDVPVSGEPDMLSQNQTVLDRLWPGSRQRLDPSPELRRLLELAHADKLGEPEEHAAKRLRTFSLAVAAAARKRWDRSFTEERDRRVTEQAPADATRRTLQALRGHVARELLAELRQEGIEGLQPARISKTRQKVIAAGWRRAIARVQETPSTGRKKGGAR